MFSCFSCYAYEIILFSSKIIFLNKSENKSFIKFFYNILVEVNKHLKKYEQIWADIK